MKKLIFLFGLSLFFISCNEKQEITSELISLVPPKTAVVLKTDKLKDVAQELQQNSFIKANPDLPVTQFFKELYQPISTLNLNGESLLLFSKIGKNEIASTLLIHASPEVSDSLSLELTQSFQYNGVEIKEYLYQQKPYFAAQLNGSFVMGDSKLVVENIIRLSKDKISSDEQLEKLVRTTNSKKLSVFIHLPESEKIFSDLTPNLNLPALKDFTNWISLNLQIKNNGFHISGVTIAEKREILGILQDSKPQKNEIAQITPTSANGFFSFTYDDVVSLTNHISFYRKEDYPQIKTDLISHAREMGTLYIGNQKAFVLKSDVEDETQEILQHLGQLEKEHRGMNIYRFDQPSYFQTALYPFIDQPQLNYYTQLDRFFVFSKDLNLLETIISNYQNKTILGESEAYLELTRKLDDKSSVLLVGMTQNWLQSLAEGVDPSHQKAYEATKVSGYNLGAIQFIQHDNFVYVNGDLVSTGQTESLAGGVQTQSIKPGEEIQNGPWFFENWRTHHYDVAMQGKSNMLYVYDEKGKLRWTRQLDGPIIGDIQPIDIYQNKRIQMAFVTSQTFYIIDREGNIVKPFNKTFQNTITQPLAIFDYSNNGTFRFLITQEDRLTMLDKNLKTVTGFEFTKAKSRVLQPPVHYRLGNKDYILIPEASGHLNILNPRGHTRIDVKTDIDFSDNAWYLYNGLFTSTNTKGQLVQIDQNGGMNLQNLKLDKDHGLFATAKTLVTFSENKLTIKGKTVKLDYGVYGQPKIFYLRDKLYITITDLQAHKVYLFDSNAKALSGFPVYGNSAIDMAYTPNQGVLLAVKGEEDSILLYEVN